MIPAEIKKKRLELVLKKIKIGGTNEVTVIYIT
jgi:hypothetical protein